MKKSMVVIISALTLASGCASWPKAVKVVATPVAAVRDGVDLFLAPVADSTYHLGRDALKNSDAFCSDGRIGFNIDFSPLIYLPISGATGTVDYFACRSLVDSYEGLSPWRSDKSYGDFGTPSINDTLFPNLTSLWGKSSKK